MISRSAAISAAKLAPREEHFRIPSHHDCLALFLRYLPPNRETEPSGTVVLYVHGGTFPSALSIAHRFAGRSSRDELCDAGFHVWGSISTASAGFPTPTQRWTSRPPGHPPLGPAEDASRQIKHAVRFICAHQRMPRISIIAHSWGSIASGRFAGRCPELVDRNGARLISPSIPKAEADRPRR